MLIEWVHFGEVTSGRVNLLRKIWTISWVTTVTQTHLASSRHKEELNLQPQIECVVSLALWLLSCPLALTSGPSLQRRKPKSWEAQWLALAPMQLPVFQDAGCRVQGPWPSVLNPTQQVTYCGQREKRNNLPGCVPLTQTYTHARPLQSFFPGKVSGLRVSVGQNNSPLSHPWTSIETTLCLLGCKALSPLSCGQRGRQLTLWRQYGVEGGLSWKSSGGGSVPNLLRASVSLFAIWK